MGRRSAIAVMLWLAACSAHHPSVAGTCHDPGDCGDGERCDWPAGHACGADDSAGHCVAAVAGLCPYLAYEVCGCDGVSYPNQCFADAEAVAIDYGGPCRPAGTYVACTTGADCPDGPDSAQACIDDPRDACTGAGCPGVCAHAAYNCDASNPCSSETSMSETESPGTEVCVAVLGAAADDPAGRCVYTTRQSCAQTSDCGAGELCVPGIGGHGACVRP